ncbi:hypothetical protein OG758_14850 [Streptomyces sp. NBC_01474]|nr:MULTISPECIES: hypothetical protein [unclassified Streptomyces]WSD95285.1 hypothetical protein OG758_14850 [Streptomyces sp. NBC_01474]
MAAPDRTDERLCASGLVEGRRTAQALFAGAREHQGFGGSYKGLLDLA